MCVCVVFFFSANLYNDFMYQYAGTCLMWVVPKFFKVSLGHNTLHHVFHHRFQLSHVIHRLPFLIRCTRPIISQSTTGTRLFPTRAMLIIITLVGLIGQLVMKQENSHLWILIAQVILLFCCIICGLKILQSCIQFLHLES